MPDALVVDCSVAAKWVLDEAAADAADLLDSDRAGKVSLIAPDLLLAEFASPDRETCSAQVDAVK